MHGNIRPVYGHDYAVYPDTPQLKSTLPKCRQCQEKDVKPGEDQCWECLGEQQGPDMEIWEGNIISNTYPTPGIHGTFTIGSMDVGKTISALQHRVEQLETKKTIWQKLRNLLV